MKNKRGLLAVFLTFFTAISFAKNVSPDEFWQLEQTHNPIIVDVRTADEFAAGHIPNAVNIPFEQIATISKYLTDKSKPILLYCRSGRRAEIAEAELFSLGYKNTFNGMSYQQLIQTKPKD
ncbi:rhodanese-like domain-containing protein [Photobacterium angustum]|uniref:Rhodanese-like domain-containing protein n=1 Tax=Photobacterium angustum TaxID=661 RepID=A0A855S7W4_PHOAN|nr:rhodanese-like domain-containing protein [Photobacterium angustum]KJF81844.1 phage-shock protein [Photobacterium damselae subsp. damselae]KJG37120.1 phage-shock protein [Photobacterium angustum]KJG45518.1 phage-shock protein [Photobacterium angustum]KJG46649.1 phage-shock protein [Photobacterium angustum]KJG52866.1 phage-shock protein [Photobacterium angustum]